MDEVGVHLLHQQLHDLHEVGVGERGEDDDLVEAVEELRVEGALDLALDQLLHLVEDHVLVAALEAEALALLQVLGADVGGHDDDGVLEVHGVAQAVGELAVLEDLQEQVEYVRVGFLDLIEQDDEVGLVLDTLGELAALFVADVTRR